MSASVRVQLSPCLSGGGGGADGGDDPSRRRCNLDRDHKLEPHVEEEEESDEGERTAGSAPLRPPRGRRGRKNAAAAVALVLCQVCGRGFASDKALHGHLRTHPHRSWRGVLPPSMRPGSEEETADCLILLSGNGRAAERRKYPCASCGRDFETRQALGGHRASHRKREGCHARAAGRPPVQLLCEEDCAAESSSLVRVPSPSGNSAGASTSTNAVQEQELTSEATRRRRRRRRRALDFNRPPPQLSDSNNGNGSGSTTVSGAGDDSGDRNKLSSISGGRNNM